MSGVWGWFGGAAAQKRKDSPKNAILGLRAQLEMLQKRKKHLEMQMDEQDALARKNINSNKNGTLPMPSASRPSLTRRLHSRQGSAQAQEGPRAQPRTDGLADRNPRAANKRHRVGQHQPRDARRHGARGRGHEADPRQADAGEGRRDNVRTSENPVPEGRDPRG